MSETDKKITYSMSLPPGTKLDKYELQSVLGQGSGGISYLAWDCQLERDVVLKEHFPLGLCCRTPEGADVVALNEVDFARSLDSFCREARLLAGLSNPHMVPVHEIFSACGTAFMVMGYVEGVTFDEWMMKKPTAAILRKVLSQLLSVLEYLHANGIIHRDIKPSNIMMREDDTPVLIDFGAATVSGVSHTQTLIGSPGYAAPEQFVPGNTPSPAADIYALGRTMLLSAAVAEIKLPRRLRRSLEKACEMNKNLRHKSAREWKRRLNFPHAIVWAFVAVVSVACFVCWYAYRAGSDLIHELGR